MHDDADDDLIMSLPPLQYSGCRYKCAIIDGARFRCICYDQSFPKSNNTFMLCAFENDLGAETLYLARASDFIYLNVQVCPPHMAEPWEIYLDARVSNFKEVVFPPPLEAAHVPRADTRQNHVAVRAVNVFTAKWKASPHLTSSQARSFVMSVGRNCQRPDANQ